MIPPSPLVDWRLAERAAGLISSDAGPRHDGYRAEEVRVVAAEATELVGDYAGLGAVEDPPTAELIDRRAWTQNALRTLAEAALPIEEQAAARLAAAGPLGSVARRIGGAAAGAEAGVAAGYAARRVLGQYDLALWGVPRPPRLLFVGENLDAARRELDADRAVFLRWVALHEATHVVQFERVEWLADYLRELASELLGAAARGVDAAAMRALVREAISSPRDLVRRLLRGELARVLADPQQRAILDRLQAAMSVIEGHADHVMDRAAPELDGALSELRARLEQRRARRGGLGDVVARLLGMDLKLRQYRLGKAFCDEVVNQADEDELHRVWRSPGDLPDLEELAQPRRWLARVGAAA